jgi:uracil-DNA glycosylase
MKFFEWQLVRCRACCRFKSCVGQVDAEKLAQQVIGCDRVSRRILIVGTEPGRLGSSRWEEALELA